MDFILIQVAGLLTFVILHSMMIDEVVLVSFLSTVVTTVVLSLMKFYRYKIPRSSVELSIVTGLRPGEKLYEELLADEDLTIPTDDKLVFKAKLNDHKLMPEEFDEFLNGIDEYSEFELVDKLQYFVPEFMKQGAKILLEGN